MPATTASDVAADELVVYVVVPANTALRLREPPPSRSLIEAIPAEVSWAVPRRCWLVQCVAVASQKFTTPRVTGVDPDLTVAVKVRTVPTGTELAAVPPEVIDRVVVDAVAA